jgi:hypothetical protein
MGKRCGYLNQIMKVTTIIKIVRKTSIDSSVFWISIYSAPIFWGVFFFLEVIGFKWMWVVNLFI